MFTNWEIVSKTKPGALVLPLFLVSFPDVGVVERVGHKDCSKRDVKVKIKSRLCLPSPEKPSVMAR